MGQCSSPVQLVFARITAHQTAYDTTRDGMPYMICSTIFGVDSHARTTLICAFETQTGVITIRTFRGNKCNRANELE